MTDGCMEVDSGENRFLHDDSTSSPKVGIFWSIGDVIISDAVTLEMSETYGEARQYGGHHEFWLKLDASNAAEYRLKSHAYDYYPRGRVVYFPNSGTFILYADLCLSPNDLRRIIRLFTLDGHTTVVDEDDHYRCSRCNRFYME